jgi:hypothetical protein
VKRKSRVLVHPAQEGMTGHGEHNRIAESANRDREDGVFQQGPLAERIAFTQRAEAEFVLSVALQQFDFAFLDDVHAIAQLALMTDGLAIAKLLSDYAHAASE